jgi:predicted negative regulator of RcsB-dependent stress response
VDEYLSEKEQIERIRAWWKENGAWIIVGIGVGVLGLAGWNWWKAYKIEQAEEASAIYATLSTAASSGRTDAARAELDRLQADYSGTPYPQQGRLALAAALVLAGETAEATALLETAMAATDDPELALVARLRLARLLASSGEGDRALEVAGVDDAGTFAAALAEVRGDVLAGRGDVEGARQAYREALAGVALGGVIDEAFVRMKLEALGGAGEGDAS